MRHDWLPVSAAALAIGASALFFGAETTPHPSGEGRVLRLATESPDGWLSPGVILLLGATGLLLGLPCFLTLFGRRGSRVGLVGVLCLGVGAVVLAGFAQQLVFLRSLAQRTSITDDVLRASFEDGIQWSLLMVGYAAFYLGELCVALALWRGRVAPRWVALLFVGHVLTVPVARALEAEAWDTVSSLLMAAALAGTAIAANHAGTREHSHSITGDVAPIRP